MKPAVFAYHAPRSAEEALDLLETHGNDEARIIAGGQSLVPMMAYRLARPAHLIDINGISELGTMTADADMLRIGAGVRHTAFYDEVAPGPIGAFLQNVVHYIADHPIRVRGTFGGSIAHADPASEWCCIAVMLDAVIVVRNRRSERSIAASSFFLGPMTTDVRADELITEIRIPMLPGDTRCGFAEFSRRPGDFGIAMVAASYRIADGRIAEPRLAVGGVEDRPRRILEAERCLAGATLTGEAFREAASVAAAAVDPLEDGINDAAFRRSLLLALVPQALERAA
jgi:aerobic carbon-monoxide dehydrogenase medium subunit